MPEAPAEDKKLMRNSRASIFTKEDDEPNMSNHHTILG